MQVIITTKELAANFNLMLTVADAIGKGEGKNMKEVFSAGRQVLTKLVDATDAEKAKLVASFNEDYAVTTGMITIKMDDQGNLITNYAEQAVIDITRVVEDEAEFFVTTGLMVMQFLKMVKGRMSSFVKRIEKIERSYTAKAE